MEATSKKERGRVVGGGAGGFLNPPTHPEHTLHVETDLRRRKENRGMLSLSYAVECEWLADDVRGECERRLQLWLDCKPKIDTPEVREWIYQVLGYFRGCYQGPGGSWNAGELVIDKRDPMTSVDTHAGVHLIRKYYPEYIPTPEDFAGAYWGTKPGTVRS